MFGSKLDLSGKVNIALTDHTDNLWTDRNNNNAEYGVSLVEDIKDMTKILEYMIRTGSHAHDFYSVQQFSF